jgi:hypothetical protein
MFGAGFRRWPVGRRTQGRRLMAEQKSEDRVMASLTEFIERRLRLKVNRSKSAIARPEERHLGGAGVLDEDRQRPVVPMTGGLGCGYEHAVEGA